MSLPVFTTVRAINERVYKRFGSYLELVWCSGGQSQGNVKLGYYS